MSDAAFALIGFGALLTLIALRAPIGVAMLVVGGAGYTYLSSWHALFSYMKTNSYHQFANYTLSVVPLFILMGALAERSGIAAVLLRSAERALGRYRGGLAMAVIGACTAFGAICGSSVATTATFGRAALPELLRLNYHGGFATGTIAVGGTLGILIPPSVILVIYGIITEQNIAKLFQAALIPGLLAALLYCLTITIRVRRRPELAPPRPPVGHEPSKRSWPLTISGLLLSILLAVQLIRGEWALGTVVAPAILAILVMLLDAKVVPVLIIAFTVVGGIYGGVFTPTEGASVGTVAMLVTGLVQRTLDWPGILRCLRQTAETSGMIFIILLGAEVFGAFLALARLPSIAAELVGGSGLSPMAVLVGILAFYIVLGAVMDELAMILLTLPVFFPVIQGLDLGMAPDEVAIWFGILVLITVGIGLTAPPMGLNVFVVNSLAPGVTLPTIYRGVLPFVAADLFRLALIVVFPSIALWLVRLLA